jgi:hypothetical protein
MEERKNYWLTSEAKAEYKRLLSRGEKKCSSCGEIKKLENNFNYKKSSKKYESKCNDCMVHYRRKLKPLTKEVELRYNLHEQKLKKCPICETIKPYSDYGVNKKSFGGIMAMCRSCKSIVDKEYRNDPKHRQKNLDRKKEYYFKIKDTQRHKDNQKRSQENRDYKKEYSKAMSDEFKRFKQRMRQLTNVHLKKRKDWVKKDTKTVDLLGADYFVVKEFIGRQFLKGMTWDNHGKVWHIDHIIPLDAAGKDPVKLKRLCYYQNLTPMLVNDNLKKGHRVPMICTLWENPIVPYKEMDVVIVPEHDGFVGRYKLRIPVGDRYGMLEVVSDDEISKSTSRWDKRMIKVKCDCGVQKEMPLQSLRTHGVKSCGCLQKINSSNYNSKYKKLNFTNEELLELVKFVKIHPKCKPIPDDVVQKYQGRTYYQIQSVVRSIRNNTLKRLNHIK